MSADPVQLRGPVSWSIQITAALRWHARYACTMVLQMQRSTLTRHHWQPQLPFEQLATLPDHCGCWTQQQLWLGVIAAPACDPLAPPQWETCSAAGRRGAPQRTQVCIGVGQTVIAV